MNAYERSYKRAGADGEANSALIETLRADGIFPSLRPNSSRLSRSWSRSLTGRRSGGGDASACC